MLLNDRVLDRCKRLILSMSDLILHLGFNSPDSKTLAPLRLLYCTAPHIRTNHQDTSCPADTFVFCMPKTNIPQDEPSAQQTPTESANKRDMTTAVYAEPSALARPKRPQPILCPTDADAIVPHTKPKLDKQSVEYILKSGLAGGLAGCAVRPGTRGTRRTSD